MTSKASSFLCNLLVFTTSKSCLLLSDRHIPHLPMFLPLSPWGVLRQFVCLCNQGKEMCSLWATNGWDRGPAEGQMGPLGAERPGELTAGSRGQVEGS